MSDCRASFDAFTSEINYWKSTLNGNDSNNIKLFELSFFKVFIKFELFLVDAFISYSIGDTNFKGYISERKLDFEDVRHLDGILRNNRNSFIDYFDKIQNHSKFIFNKDPFQLIFSDSDYSSKIRSMRCIRNYIAHESSEAKRKYHDSVLGAHKTFEEPASYLSKTNRRVSKTNYSIQIDTMKKITDILLEPVPYF